MNEARGHMLTWVKWILFAVETGLQEDGCQPQKAENPDD